MTTTKIRVHSEVLYELKRRRLLTETNYDGAIKRAIEGYDLEAKLSAGGLTTTEMARLHDLRMFAAAKR